MEMILESMGMISKTCEDQTYLSLSDIIEMANLLDTHTHPCV